ncbi:MAG: hypothetical protein JWN70_4410 [Planctomycetaceae bacterium]|nr:hypothetical protein [Planctomycetaceae bacterium]
MKSFRLQSAVSTHWACVLGGWIALTGLGFLAAFEFWMTSIHGGYLLADPDPHHWTRSHFWTFVVGGGLGLILGVVHLAMRRGIRGRLMKADERLPITDANSSGAAVEDRQSKRRIMLTLFAYAPIMGVLICFLPDNEPILEFLVGAPLWILGVSWCFVDAKERDIRIGRLTRIILVLAFIVGFPLYAFQSRGIRGCKLVIVYLAVLAALCACMGVAIWATLTTGHTIGLWEVIE